MLIDPKEFQYLYGTALVFGLVTFGLYHCLLRPLLAPSGRQGLGAAPPTLPPAAEHRAAGANSYPRDASSRRHHQYSSRFPPHVSAASAFTAPSSSSSPAPAPVPSSLVVDGLVPFRQTLASRRSDDVSARDRARILSKLLLSSSSAAPSSSSSSFAAGASSSHPPPAAADSSLPPRGGTWIVSFPVTRGSAADDALWDGKIRPVLRALGTYYNLLVVLAVLDGGDGGGDDDEKKAEYTKRLRDEWIAKLRSSSPSTATTTRTTTTAAAACSAGVPSEVLPSHRIVASTTLAGRVAFVRQVQRVGIVLDFDPAVQEQLSRFGHRVVVYDVNVNL